MWVIGVNTAGMRSPRAATLDAWGDPGDASRTGLHRVGGREFVRPLFHAEDEVAVLDATAARARVVKTYLVLVIPIMVFPSDCVS